MIQEPETALRYLHAHPELAGPSGSANDFLKVMSSFGIVMVARRDPAAAHLLLPELLPEDQRKDPEQFLAMCEILSDPAKALTSTPLDELEHADEIVGV
jgi:hypothetical protein